MFLVYPIEHMFATVGERILFAIIHQDSFLTWGWQARSPHHNPAPQRLIQVSSRNELLDSLYDSMCGAITNRTAA